jgi:hypothetical protein
VNSFAPKLANTKVVLSSADISPFSGSGTLRGFVLGNPAGWSDANLVADRRRPKPSRRAASRSRSK